jgi:hypothetical protein
MKTYRCVCGQLIFFQNAACLHCIRELGFLPDLLRLTSLDQVSNGLWQPSAEEARGALYKKCQNYAAAGVCNWMIPQNENESFCASCRLNEIIPDLSSEQNRNLWARIENSKRRLVYSLIRLNLPIQSKKADPQRGIAFRFLSDAANPASGAPTVMTGHDHGIITLNIAEADDAKREAMRSAMNEPQRTLLGHFRHEIGHYYWGLLVGETKFLEPYRELFGNELNDYTQALNQYYKSGAPANWQERYISAYATAHPWEDWAETWAHIMHVQDALEVASDFALAGKRIFLDPQDKSSKPWLSSNPVTFDEVIGSRSELVVALNSFIHSIGLPDLYPFALSPLVIAKLRFVYAVIAASRTSSCQNSAFV